MAAAGVDAGMVVRDPVTGLFGFRVELGRDRAGVRMQARRSGFLTEQASPLSCGYATSAGTERSSGRPLDSLR
jgi:hypothetical protein